LSHQRFHLIELFGRWLFVIVTQYHAPDFGCANVAGEIDAHALLLESGKILAESAPVGSDVVVIVGGTISLDDGIIERRDGSAFAGDFRGDALENLGGTRGSTSIVSSDWPSISIKPGATTLPPASMVRVRPAPARFPIEAILPARTPMSPEYQGEPVPSMMWPLVMTMSKVCGGSGAEGAARAMAKTMRIANRAAKGAVRMKFSPYLPGHVTPVPKQLEQAIARD
jgi:hypothetical protein